MCRTVFLRPTELEAHAAQAQKSSLPPYTPYIPPHVANLRNPVPPTPVVEAADSINAFKLPPGLQIVEPSSPLADDLDMELKSDFAISVAEPEVEEPSIQSFEDQPYSAFSTASAARFETAQFAFPSDSFGGSGLIASPPSFDEAEQDMPIPAQFSDMDSTSDGCSPVAQMFSVGNGRRGSVSSSAESGLAAEERKPFIVALQSSTTPKSEWGENAGFTTDIAAVEARVSSSETVDAQPFKPKKGTVPRVEKWKRRDNEKHLAGERKRRANRMGKLGELKELLPNTKAKLSSIKILSAAISHFKKILAEDPVPKLSPVKVEEEVKQRPAATCLTSFTFVQGMRDSQFLSLIEMDSNQVVLHCSPAMKSFLGIEGQSGNGFHISTIVHPSDCADPSLGFTAHSNRTLQLRFGCFLHNGHRVFVPSTVTASSDHGKTILIINPLPAVYDHGGQSPVLIH